MERECGMTKSGVSESGISKKLHSGISFTINWNYPKGFSKVV